MNNDTYIAPMPHKGITEALLTFAHTTGLRLTGSDWDVRALMAHFGSGYPNLRFEPRTRIVNFESVHGKPINSTFAELLSAMVDVLPTVTVRIPHSEYTAVIKSDKSGVDVGCTFVPKETVKAVYDLLYKKEK